MKHQPLSAGAIGVFDSGYGGLTILSEIRKQMPEYDYIYLGDNSRAPYGGRSFEVIYEFTKQAVLHLFGQGCNLVILACNTASAKALRTIQQVDLPQLAPHKRVLGVIRPTAEVVGQLTSTKHIGVLGTSGTIQSGSYQMEVQKLFPDVQVQGQECLLWAALVEAGYADSEGADFFVRSDIQHLLAKDDAIDTVILGCTHYPLLQNKIRQYLPAHIQMVPQGGYVAQSLKDYLFRHPEMDSVCTKKGTVRYLTTESPERFRANSAIFLNEDVKVEKVVLG